MLPEQVEKPVPFDWAARAEKRTHRLFDTPKLYQRRLAKELAPALFFGC